jgi:hypothetical protein
MEPLPPTPGSRFAITLTGEEQDDLTNRIMAGDGDERALDDNGGVVRCGRRVVTEHAGTFVCEQFDSEDRARERFDAIARVLGFEPPDQS